MPRTCSRSTGPLLVAVALACVLAAPSAAKAQEPDPTGPDRPSFEAPRISLAVYGGRGPDHHAAHGVELEYRLAPWLGVLAEYSGWTDGWDRVCLNGPGIVCPVSGRAILAGIRLHRSTSMAVSPYAEFLGGTFSPEHQDASSAAGLGAGGEFHISTRWQVRFGGRYLRAFDDRYESHAGESLDFGVLNLAVVFGFGG